MTTERQATHSPHDCVALARVEALEDKMRNASATHKEFYDRLRALEMGGAVQEERYNTIIEKLDGLTETVEEVRQRPARRWDTLVDKALAVLVGAVLAFLLTNAGL